MDDFVNAVRATKELEEQRGFTPPDIFGPPPETVAELVEHVAGPGQVPGQPKIRLDYKAQRFFIGKQLTHVDKDGKHYEDVDDSGALKEVMDEIFNGKAMKLNRETKLMENGSIVIWLEWGTYIESVAPPPEERTYFTKDELLSPERLSDKPNSGLKAPPWNLPASPAEPSEESAADEDEEPAEAEASTDEEPDW